MCWGSGYVRPSVLILHHIIWNAACAGETLDTYKSKEDMLSQEVRHLNDYIRLCEERVSLLKSLKQISSSSQLPLLPGSHARALQEKMPMFADTDTEEDKIPTSSADDYLVSKRVIQQTGVVSKVSFMPVKAAIRLADQKAPTNQPLVPAAPSAILVALAEDGKASLYSASGELLHSFPTGHKLPVTHLVTSPSIDEHFVATADTAGHIRVHSVKVRPSKLSSVEKEERASSLDEKTSQYLMPQFNVTTQLNVTMKINSSLEDPAAPKLTAFIAAQKAGSKYFVVGDADGKITVFTRNGTLRAKFDATVTKGPGVQSFHVQTNYLVYTAGSEWGFVNLERMEVEREDCPMIEGNVAAAITDSHLHWRAIVVDEDGTPWVFNIKNKTDCKADFMFPRGVLRNVVGLASTRGFVLVLENAGTAALPMSVIALNVSHVIAGQQGRKRPGNTQPRTYAGPPGVHKTRSHIVWRKPIAAIRDWAVHKRSSEGDLLAFVSKDGKSVEILELLMPIYTPPAETIFSMRLPAILTAIAAVITLTYYRAQTKMNDDGMVTLASRSLQNQRQQRHPYRGRPGGSFYDDDY